MSGAAARSLDLDLDAFQGPFDLLLTLVLKEELELADVDVAAIVLTFVARLAERSPARRLPPLGGAEHGGEDRKPLDLDAGGEERKSLDLDACGEFLVLVAALLELKAGALFPEEIEPEDLDLEEAAGELAERLAAYRRYRLGARWLEERLEAERDRFFRVGPAPYGPAPRRPLPREDVGRLASALRALAAEPPAPSLRHLGSFPPVSLFLERFRAVLRARRRFVFDREVDRLSRVEQAAAFLALLELRKAGEVALRQPAPFAPIGVSRA